MLGLGCISVFYMCLQSYGIQKLILRNFILLAKIFIYSSHQNTCICVYARMCLNYARKIISNRRFEAFFMPTHAALKYKSKCHIVHGQIGKNKAAFRGMPMCIIVTSNENRTETLSKTTKIKVSPEVGPIIAYGWREIESKYPKEKCK